MKPLLNISPKEHQRNESIKTQNRTKIDQSFDKSFDKSFDQSFDQLSKTI